MNKYWLFKKGHKINLGRECKKETRKKIGNAHRGKFVSIETREKLKKSLTGRKLPKEICEKISKSRIGKKHSEETRLKLKNAHERRRKAGLSGRHISHGYVLIRMPEHPNCHKSGYIEEHRLIMEKYLGRYLRREEIVHHINENTIDNRIENLKLFNNASAHIKYHKAMLKEIL